jgi:hypothetical protein
LPCDIRKRVKGNDQKSSNAKQPLFIYNSSATLEPFLMLRCTVGLFHFDQTHYQHTSYQCDRTTSTDVTTPQIASLLYSIIMPPSRHFLTLSQHLCLSVTQCFPHHPPIPIIIPRYFCSSSKHDNISELDGYLSMGVPNIYTLHCPVHLDYLSSSICLHLTSPSNMSCSGVR